jgi:hypothetical protein
MRADRPGLLLHRRGRIEIVGHRLLKGGSIRAVDLQQEAAGATRLPLRWSGDDGARERLAASMGG